MMKVLSLRWMRSAVVLAIACSGATRAQDATADAVSTQSLRAKIQYCSTCHGLSGQGYRGFYTMPRLAGQQREYVVNQLKAFAGRKRKSQFMYNVAQSLNPSMMSSLAAHFSSLNPNPLGGARKLLAAEGRKIYEEGIPEANVPACMACHGPEAHGRGEIPRLAGQLPEYLASNLANWDTERRPGSDPDGSSLMSPISHSLTKPQVAAVTAYVSTLK